MDFKEGEILLVDKPYGWTSFDVVNKLRYALRRKYDQKKFKIGHAGTLDPLATGLLVLCTGKKTKEIEQHLSGEKTYTGSFLLGHETPSFDLESKFSVSEKIERIADEKLIEIAQQMTGEILQTPPIFSAKKVGGKRAYELARAGEEVKMNKHLITIHSFEIETSKFPVIDFSIKCSKGTYIRSIAHDFGQACNTNGTLICLRRVESGSFNLKDGRSVSDTIRLIKEN